MKIDKYNNIILLYDIYNACVIYIYVNVYVYMYVYICVCVCTCVCVCVCICMSLVTLVAPSWQLMRRRRNCQWPFHGSSCPLSYSFHLPRPHPPLNSRVRQVAAAAAAAAELPENRVGAFPHLASSYARLSSSASLPLLSTSTTQEEKSPWQ